MNVSKNKYREITIDQAGDTQEYSHEEMADLVFIEKKAFQDLKADFDKLKGALEFTVKQTSLYSKDNKWEHLDGSSRRANITLSQVKDWDL